MKKAQYVCLLWCTIMYNLTAIAQSDSVAAIVPVTQAKVISFKNLRADAEKDIRSGDLVEVGIENPSALFRSNQPDTAGLLMYINSIPMSGIPLVEYDRTNGKVIFKITRNTGYNPWNVFYTSVFEPSFVAQSISIGYTATGAIPTTITSAAGVRFILIRDSYLIFALCMVVFVLLLWLYGNNRGMLRDNSAIPDIQKRPYSMARTQLAFWTLIVSVSYIFIALVTGELAPLSTSTLVLLGVSGATTATAALIDSNDILNNAVRHQNTDETKGWLTDLLSDNNGISVHRFQMLVFNMILGIFFLQQVFTYLHMPEFGNNMLVLLGISNGTYAGIKILENKNTEAPANPN